MKKILLYESSAPVITCFKKMSDIYNMKLILIGDASLSDTLNTLFHLEKEDLSEHVAFQNSFLIMDSIQKEELVQMLEFLSSLGLEYEGIKVMHTKTNDSWTLKKIFEETTLEHRIFNKRNELKKLLEQCNKLEYGSVSNEKMFVYKEQILHAFILLNSGKVEEKDLDSSILELKNLIKNLS